MVKLFKKGEPIVKGDDIQSPAQKLPLYDALLKLLTFVASGAPEASCVLTMPQHGEFKVTVSRPTALEASPAGEA